MSQPTTENIALARRFFDDARATEENVLRFNERILDFAQAIAAFRLEAYQHGYTEGAEAMREKCAEFADFHIRTTKNPSELGDLLRTLPTTEGDTTTTEDTGEETQT